MPNLILMFQNLKNLLFLFISLFFWRGGVASIETSVLRGKGNVLTRNPCFNKAEKSFKTNIEMKKKTYQQIE